MDADLPRARVRLQFQGRLLAWAKAHPEHRAAVLEWLARFRADPFDPALHPLARPTRNDQRLFEYDVPGAPLAVLVVIQPYEDLNGILLARVLYPASPDDVVPDH